jgi:hypothetical protein
MPVNVLSLLRGQKIEPLLLFISCDRWFNFSAHTQH